MNRMKIVIDFDNAAFDDDPGTELARILEDLAKKAREDRIGPGAVDDGPVIQDKNGNTIGEVSYYVDFASANLSCTHLSLAYKE